MTIKPEPALNLPHRLENPGLVQLSGRDALSFAQSQFANDVTQLADGQWQWNLWLSAKGRVLALFALVRLDAQTLLLWLPDLDAESLAGQLQRFRFRSKVEIGALGEAVCRAGFESPERCGSCASGDLAQIERDATGKWSRITLDMGGAVPRTLCLLSRSDGSGATDAESDGAANARWRALDIAHGLPRLRGEGLDAFTPQMLGLERLRAFSVKKGCYPGQEIVARTHFLGQAKRGPLRFALQQRVEAGARLGAESGESAQVVSVAESHGRFEVLAVGPREAAAPGWRTESGCEAELLALLDGLARPAGTPAAPWHDSADADDQPVR